MRQALEEERRRQRLESDPPENVVDFWRGEDQSPVTSSFVGGRRLLTLAGFVTPARRLAGRNIRP